MKSVKIEAKVESDDLMESTDATKKSLWNPEMTFKFIELCLQKSDILRNHRYKKKDVFQEIAAEMSEQGYLNLVGHELNIKLRNMKKYFFSIRQHLTTEQRLSETSSWPYYSALCPLFGADSDVRCTEESFSIKSGEQSEGDDTSSQINEDSYFDRDFVIDTSHENWWMDINDMDYQKIFRLSKSSFTRLQGEINHFENIYNSEPDILLLATLWFLGSADTLEDISYMFDIDLMAHLEDQLKRILLLSGIYLKWPEEKEVEMIEKHFRSIYQFPGVVGVLGCAYIEVDVSYLDDEKKIEYYNEAAKKNLIILQAVADCNFLLRNVSIGFGGSFSIEKIFYNSPLYKILNQRNSYLSRTGKHIIGGSEHPQMEVLLTPFRLSKITSEETEFNILHSKVLNVIEKTFIRMGNRFIRMNSVDCFDPDLATLIISSICILHNFTIVKKDICRFDSSNG